jgi:predicted hydrocarbon binding protein
MESKSIHLDNSAEELYAQLGGVEVRKLKKLDFSGSDRLAQSLLEEQRRYDALRAIIADLVYQIGICLDRRSKSDKKELESMTLLQFERIFGILNKNPQVGNKTLIRYRGAFGENRVDNKTDYEVLAGNISLDAEVARAIAKAQGKDPCQVLEKLNRGFEALWSKSINNILINIPKDKQELNRLWISLQFAGLYFAAVEKNSPITMSTFGRSVSLRPIHNENNVPDLNLTLLAVLNGLHPKKIQAMVHKVNSLMQSTAATAKKYRYTSIYDAMMKIKHFRSQLKPTPIEVNNIKWLMVSNDHTPISDQMAKVARLVMVSSGGSSTETARVLKSVYGEDYAKIDSQQIAERLQLTSGLLDTIEKNSKGEEIRTEVLNNVEERLGEVKEDVFDNIRIEGDRIEANTPGRGTFIEKVHSQISKMVTFHKKRSATKKKMARMVHSVIDFDNQDYETLAVDFNVSINEAIALVKMIKSCFNSQGKFSKSIFGRIIPYLERYERRIFDFLWHNLKESLHQSDRDAFLDSLQLLVDRLKQPQNSLSVLLEDLYQNSSVIRFADRKAFMLGNRLVRSYSQEIVSYQITPEDVLLMESGIDQKITNYAAWKIDKNRDKFFEKIRTIHRRLLETLDSNDEDNHLIDVQDLLALEREAYIFLALVGGITSRSVLLSALKEYGHPDSDLYQLRRSPKHITDLLQLLKIVIRCVGRVGEANEVVFIDHVIGRLEVFSQLTKSLHEKDLINQLKKSADSAKQQLLAKT